MHSVHHFNKQGMTLKISNCLSFACNRTQQNRHPSTIKTTNNFQVELMLQKTYRDLEIAISRGKVK